MLCKKTIWILFTFVFVFFQFCTQCQAENASGESIEIGGGGSTEVTGLRLKRETSERDLQELNVAINTVQPPGRGRKRRESEFPIPIAVQNENHNNRLKFLSSSPLISILREQNSQRPGSGIISELIRNRTLLAGANTRKTPQQPKLPFQPDQNENQGENLSSHHHHSATSPKNHHNHENPIAKWERKTYKILTEIQKRFAHVNRNFSTALAFYNSHIIQKNALLKDSVIVDENGVSCEHVCDPHTGLGFGLLGFCTPKYCSCFNKEAGDGSTGTETAIGTGKKLEFKEQVCPDNLVFDPNPLKLTCSHPSDTILCADPKV